MCSQQLTGACRFLHGHSQSLPEPAQATLPAEGIKVLALCYLVMLQEGPAAYRDGPLKACHLHSLLAPQGGPPLGGFLMHPLAEGQHMS